MLQAKRTAVVIAVVYAAFFAGLAEAQEADKLFRKLDRNNDGRLELAEIPKDHQRKFKAADANDDGAISPAELKSFLEGGQPRPEPQPESRPVPARQEFDVRIGPNVLRGGDHGVGHLAVNASFDDLSGTTRTIARLAKEHRAVVIAMTSTSCPLSQKYLPTMVNLSKSYSARGVGFVLVNPRSTDDEKMMRQTQETLGKNGVYVFDRQGKLASALGALTTTDVLVIDSSRTVVYHGAVDDQYGFGYSLDAPRKTFLADALDAILDRRAPLIEATAAPGCELDIDRTPHSVKDITYFGRISRIIQNNCVECHRAGGVAPFPLDSHEDVVSHAPMIRQVITRGVMPPWFAAQPKDHGASPWANDRSLASAEKNDLLAWINGGRAKGDISDAPQPRVFADEWQIGEPDAVFAFDKPVSIKASGTMPYVNVTVETDLDEDKWVQAVEILPSERAVVHHVLVLVHGSRGINYWAIYVPGNGAKIYPPGYARLLPRGTRLRFQMHYTPIGRATQDRTRIGFVFADKPPKHVVKTTSIVNKDFKIAPRDDNYKVVKNMQIHSDMQILGYLPHHHLRGKASRYELISASGQPEMLLDVPRYDFNWQLFYQYATPRIVNRGDTIRFTAWYDNSSANPANPNPNKAIGWGNQTYDEMHVGYIEYTTYSQ